MTSSRYPEHQPQAGYMTNSIRAKYIHRAVEKQLLPPNAHRMEDIISLTASDELSKPIQFWQLYSVLGTDRILAIVSRFYERVYNDEQWFTSVFARIASKDRHIAAQASMWIDVMGGGHLYHGGEFRLNFHHTHNAMALMTNKGAERWTALMIATLNDADLDLTDDPRVRIAINTFLSYFMEKYTDEFKLTSKNVFGETNASLIRRINSMNTNGEWAQEAN